MIAPRLILVTDPFFGDERVVQCIQAAGRSLPAGALCVQLRDRQRPIVSLRIFASRLRIVTRTVGATLLINGNPRLARDVGADGVHLGRDAGTVEDARSIVGERAWISVSAHSDGAVARGVDAGADAVLVSPVFPSRAPSALAPGKEARGLQALRTARARAQDRAGIYALGGVNEDNARACVEAGASGVAVLRALLANPEPAHVARAIHDAMAAR